ncbi:MFS transporter (plasmid) [Nostoc edaphicum CCNP1411]|uniref:MFS transporter n=1 Tax=Nostoc edaphicum CCNP1411 TaxID=1472755 RepID=A0A7D7LDF4_9NOSO|nr:MFS transporter [Nostoc edaphicum]QMS86247.1 MFS transporter [Nostoc edaphicum CCNP1411]
MQNVKTKLIDRSECKQATLIGACAAGIMLTINITSVGVALDSIRQELNASFAQLQWVMNAYNLAFGAFLLSAGSMADLWGRRRFFSIGIALFIVAALLSGLSQDPLMLNFSRSVAGICGALVLPSGSALIASVFRNDAERAKAFGIFGACLGIGLAFGTTIGGAIITAWSWRWIFLINIPISLGVLILAVPKMCESKDPEATSIDWLGLVSFSLSLFLLIYGLTNGSEAGWGNLQTLGTLLGAIVGFTLFITLERSQRYPMFDLELFHNPTFVAAQILPIIVAFVFLTPLVYLPLYFQGINNYSPLQAGLAILPLTIPVAGVPALAGRLANHFSVRALVSVGLVLNGLGALWLSRTVAETEGIALVSALLIIGTGTGIVNGLLDNLAVSVVNPEHSGMASGIFNTMRLTGDAITIGGAGAILTSLTQSRLSDLLWGTSVRLGSSTAQIANQIARGDINGAATTISAGREIFTKAAIESYSSAYSNLFVIVAFVSLVGALLTLILVRSRDMFSSSISQPEASRQP